VFTGLVQTIGEIISREERGSGIEVVIAAPDYAGSFAQGESIAVDGCCLTVESWDGPVFKVFASPETMEKTSLGDRVPGDGVNLERALALGDRLGGHMVSGHVDATGRLRSVRELGDAWEVWIDAPAIITSQSVPKGSVTVDGISLTIVELTDDGFSLWIIPETWQRTTLSRRGPGDRVNLESDLIGKYVRRFVGQMLGDAEADTARLDAVWRAFRS